MGGKNKWHSGSSASSIGSGITKGTSALIGPTLQLAENGPDIYEMADAIDKNRRLLKELDDLEMSDDEYQNTQKTRIQGYCPK